MIRLSLVIAILLAASAGHAVAETIRVPQDHKTIQAAIDVATAGDTVLWSRRAHTASGCG
ncbi:MAG: hypothetical protein FD138_4541 [Planctomycetota bacterium]|nr:MAG: hypothetical protein FD138_4541 [Planctomycetota bacterium]